MKKVKTRAAHIITIVCLIAASVLLYFLIKDIFGVFGGATVLEFKADSDGNNGFSRETMVYTEDGTTSVTFSGNITTDGTADIAMLSEDGNTTIYSKAYTAITSKKIRIDIAGLTPGTYYILRFSSNDAKKGHLILTTEQALAERPVHPDRATP